MLQVCVCMSMHFSAHIGFCESTKAWITYLDKRGAEQLMAEHWWLLSQLLSALDWSISHTKVCWHCSSSWAILQPARVWATVAGWGYKTHIGCWLCNGLIRCATARALLMPLQTQVCLSCAWAVKLVLHEDACKDNNLPRPAQVEIFLSAFTSTCSLRTLCCCAFWMVVICWATTDSTSISMRLNSSKQAHAPELSKEVKMRGSGASHRSKLAVRSSARSRNYKSTYWGGSTETRSEAKRPLMSHSR